jgi:hypothetical protein
MAITILTSRCMMCVPVLLLSCLVRHGRASSNLALPVDLQANLGQRLWVKIQSASNT